MPECHLVARLPVGFRVDLRAKQNRQPGAVEPEDQDDDPGEGAVGGDSRFGA